jgi:hypothetical protein
MRKYITKLSMICVILVTISACTAVPTWRQWMLEGPPPGQEYPPLYIEGWQDGCESGISASSNQWYKLHYSFQQDPYKAQDRVYYKGWKDAFDYCQRYMYQWKSRALL